jgi:hypothetical protein
MAEKDLAVGATEKAHVFAMVTLKLLALIELTLT